VYLCVQYVFHNKRFSKQAVSNALNPSNIKLNPICHLLALLGAHYILHVSRVRVKVLTSPGVYSTVTLYGTAFNKETPQMKNRNGTRSNVEHVKFVVVNKKVRTLFTEKKTHTREEERN